MEKKGFRDWVREQSNTRIVLMLAPLAITSGFSGGYYFSPYRGNSDTGQDLASSGAKEVAHSPYGVKKETSTLATTNSSSESSVKTLTIPPPVRTSGPVSTVSTAEADGSPSAPEAQTTTDVQPTFDLAVCRRLKVYLDSYVGGRRGNKNKHDNFGSVRADIAGVDPVIIIKNCDFDEEPYIATYCSIKQTKRPQLFLEELQDQLCSDYQTLRGGRRHNGHDD